MALDVSVFLAVGMVCGLYAAADSLMGLLGPGMGDGVEVLRWMCMVALLRTVSTAMSPLILIGGWQTRAAWLTVASVTLQVAGLFALAPRFGAMGAMATCLAIELVLGALGISLVGQRAARVRLGWSAPLRLLLCGAAAMGASRLFWFSGTLASGVVCGLLFLALGYASGAISMVRLQRFAEELREHRVGVGVPPAGGR
jgi:O-antigen/teichoic acid export membrane protein